jgi:hypothetical protein
MDEKNLNWSEKILLLYFKPLKFKLMQTQNNLPVIKIKLDRRKYQTIMINGKELKMKGDRLR